MYKIRLISPFRQKYEVSKYLFAADILLEDADALLCEWSPHEELLHFKGPKAWYHNEAQCRKLFSDPKWQYIKKEGNGKHFLSHSHSNPNYRVPMITHINSRVDLKNESRIEKAIAIISNTGANFQETKEITLRNQLSINPRTDLYGNEESWRDYMKRTYNNKNLPNNYKGVIPGNWNSREKVETMKKYAVAICLENILEEYYFTEKFFTAVQAGCIPIYHAHPTIESGILAGAKWIDPQDHNYNIEETLYTALNSDRLEFVQANIEWLKKKEVQETSLNSVFHKIGTILISNPNTNGILNA